VKLSIVKIFDYLRGSSRLRREQENQMRDLAEIQQRVQFLKEQTRLRGVSENREWQR